MKIENVLGDSIGFVELVDYMGSDAQVVNSARVSYGKQVDSLSDKDKKLIERLIRDKHVSVLRSTVFTFRVKCPMAIRNQWYRHVIGCAYASDQHGFNEISRRYTDKDIEFYVPSWDQWREQDPDNKQSSIAGATQHDRLNYEHSLKTAQAVYKNLISSGVCREQARLVLPQSLYTEFLWTASLQAVLHFLELRDKSDAQWEIQVYARALRELIEPIVPVTMTCFLEGSNG